MVGTHGRERIIFNIMFNTSKGGNMAKLTVEVEVSKEAYELMDGIKKVVESVKKALADGWQPGQDVPTILMESLTALVPAVAGAESIGSEAKEELEAFVTGLGIKSKEIGFLFYKKDEEQSAA